MNRFITTLPHVQIKKVVQTFSEVYDWGLQDLGIPEIHKQTKGEGIKIAIIDSGKSEHFEVKHNTIGAINVSDSNTVNDRNSHSTIVSGIIAAEENYQGIIGVAPKSKIFFIKAINDGGQGSPSALVHGVLQAIKQKVDIISISAGLFTNFVPLHHAIRKAYLKNIITVCAVGNSGNRYYDVAFPARYPETLGVAAYDQKHHIAPFSSRGINISFALPGVEIYSTVLNNEYASMSGTSFSAPILAGICALILAKHRQHPSNTPCETPKQMLEHLKKYAKPLGTRKEAGFGTIDTRTMFVNGI